MRYFVVPDIHGQNDKLTMLLNSINDLKSQDDCVIFLGDYIDRGHKSFDVIKSIQAFKEQHDNTITLLGNHDVMFYNAVIDISNNINVEEHLKNLLSQSSETLLSFGLDHPIIKSKNPFVIQQDISDHMVSLFNTFKQSDAFTLFKHLILNSDYYIETNDFIFSHSGGVNYLKPEEQSPTQWLWSRDFAKRRFSDKTFVVGHTPIDEDEPKQHGQILMCDTGSVFVNHRPLPLIILEES